MARINVEVDDRIQEKYYQHYEESDKYATFSQFLRTAMDNQKKCDDLGKTAFPTEGVGKYQNQSSKDIENEIQDLKNQLNKSIKALNNSMTQIQLEMQGTDDDMLLSSMMNVFHDELPRVNNKMKELLEVNLKGTSIDELVDKAIRKGNLDADLSEADARKALSKLENDVSTVESYVTDEGIRHYYEVK